MFSKCNDLVRGCKMYINSSPSRQHNWKRKNYRIISWNMSHVLPSIPSPTNHLQASDHSMPCNICSCRNYTVKKLIKLITTKCIYLGNNFGLMADICGYNSAGLDRAGVPLSITTRLAFFSNFWAACVRAAFGDFRKWDSSCKKSSGKTNLIEFILLCIQKHIHNYIK